MRGQDTEKVYLISMTRTLLFLLLFSVNLYAKNGSGAIITNSNLL